MKILFFLGHPAHYHLYKNSIQYFSNRGEVKVLIKKKDVLESLLRNANISYVNIYKKMKGNSVLSNVAALLKKNWGLARQVINFKPDIMIGAGPEIAQIGMLFQIPSLLFGEDDIDVASIMNYAAYPFATHLVSPVCCKKGRWDKKTIKYNGYQELAYLHPNHFVPEEKIVQKYISQEKPYFILRFAKLNAHHDKGKEGINNQLAQKIIEILNKKGNVYITSERKMNSGLEKYRLSIDPLDIHHFLAYSNLYVGDSQTMCAEASVLGTPSIRYNDFVGKLSYLEELEYKYDLTKGIRTGQPQKLLKLIDLFSEPGNKKRIENKKQKMLKEKIDLSKFMIWLIKNYPESKSILSENPDYQYKFS